MAKSPRFVRPYPQRTVSMIRRVGRGIINRAKLRQERPRIHAKPWRYRTGYDSETLLEERAEQGIKGSLEERLFYKALVDHGYIPYVDFYFQESILGGRAEPGGLVADFLFPIPKIIVNPTSLWHLITPPNLTQQ